mmetsp:Transcript_6186/g.17125  ORF Transcript_6186/g.17125 Transcript_6186/m.17125 type:complete len:203 (+) Transcript_6186:482-1090(+)
MSLAYSMNKRSASVIFSCQASSDLINTGCLKLDAISDGKSTVASGCTRLPSAPLSASSVSAFASCAKASRSRRCIEACSLISSFESMVSLGLNRCRRVIKGTFCERAKRISFIAVSFVCFRPINFAACFFSLVRRHCTTPKWTAAPQHKNIEVVTKSSSHMYCDPSGRELKMALLIVLMMSTGMTASAALAGAASAATKNWM